MTKASRADFDLDLAAVGGETDGRRRRSQDSRERIVAAMLELIREGEISPGAEQVALRAQVGLRTVFRHFNDMDSLYREMSKAIEAELRRLIDRPLAGETWRERLHGLVERRAVAFEKISPYRRAYDVHRHGSEQLRADNDRLIEVLRGILKAVVAPEVAADRVLFEALDMIMSYEAWARLRRDQHLSAAQASEVVERAVNSLLG